MAGRPAAGEGCGAAGRGGPRALLLLPLPPPQRRRRVVRGAEDANPAAAAAAILPPPPARPTALMSRAFPTSVTARGRSWLCRGVGVTLPGVGLPAAAGRCRSPLGRSPLGGPVRAGPCLTAAWRRVRGFSGSRDPEGTAWPGLAWPGLASRPVPSLRGRRSHPGAVHEAAGCLPKMLESSKGYEVCPWSKALAIVLSPLCVRGT